MVNPSTTTPLRSFVVRNRAADSLDLSSLGAGALAAHAALQATLNHVISVYGDQQPGVLSTIVVDAADRAKLPESPDASLRRVAKRYICHVAADNAGRATALLLLGALLDNPALAPQRSLIEETCLRPRARACRLLVQLEACLEDEPVVDRFDVSLPALLRAPAAAAPDSIADQLAFALRDWDALLTDELRIQILLACDLLAEEETAHFAGPGKAEVLEFGPGPASEGPGAGGSGKANFSEDGEWMPNLVLVAKQALVWLDQLSRRYGRPIECLDQVPDAELDELAGRGFTGLWLIGLWERSSASRDIKRRMGNPEAESSAYALWDYRIADRLGGDDALEGLRERAAARGIKLAADMVPNHVGIDGRWVVEHPDWFVQTDRPPFPGYTFCGPDLSTDDRVGVYLEDGYWSCSDAAVVFKRVDHQTGEERFLYHGNDGTQMPWNDTAQLDYLNPDVRQAIIGTIVEVARRFPVIRFDAAMTLAKKHVQRLWHPAPGSGGAIPSRAERAVSPQEFERAMPREFWQEVVAAVQEQVPDTLLLAEAFWMMEGYFVRDLGMHRVYNSAFMNMLRDEDNANYRQTIKNVLEYSPAVLERFVNFMNNPDEETAVAQFGKSDKYFGICTLMATLPGLPMFGHGQVEGLAAKYGMEAARDYSGEEADDGFVDHHARVIFPLLKQRHVFSGVKHFALFDLVTNEGHVDENVFAFSNRSPDGRERSLVIYNNAHEGTAGCLARSTAINVAAPDDAPNLEQRELADALGLRTDDGVLYGLQDARTGLWYLRSGADLADNGLWVSMDGYACHVFVGFREIVDRDGTWTELAGELWGHAVPSLDDAKAEMIRRRASASRSALEAPVGVVVQSTSTTTSTTEMASSATAASSTAR